MKRTKLSEVAAWMKGKLICGNAETEITGVSRDSRDVQEADLFFALIGENHDAHRFISGVVESGCKNMVISDEASIRGMSGVNAILVDDTTVALQDLAREYIRSRDLKKIAVTGSTGKTTTKDMLHCILTSKYNTLKTEGNLNNHIGLPLTALRVGDDTEVAVFEMGMDKPGEIDFLAELVRPQIGIITNVGISHIENFEDREGIFKAKLEIAGYMEEQDVLVVYEDNDMLGGGRASGPYNLLKVGTTGKSDFIISGIEDGGESGVSFYLENGDDMEKIALPIPGRHNAVNASLAIAAATCLGVTVAEAREALKKLEITDKRLTVKGKGGMKIIDDTYNASPDSMRSAIDTLTGMPGMRKIAILGDMNELGKNSAKYHKEIGEYVSTQSVDKLICVGKKAASIADGATANMSDENIMYFSTREEAMDNILKMISPGDTILIKGSRGMSMDQIVKRIME